MKHIVKPLRRWYNKRVIAHYENPSKAGSLNNTEGAQVGTALVGSPACGDVLKLQVKVNSDNIITEARFKTFGCGSAIASSNYAAEYIEGKSLAQALGVTNRDISRHLELPPVKLHCSMLAEDAIKMAVADAREKQKKVSRN
ncbi:MAG: Fe-S cluster assembly scaffold IscU [Euryarchaeota archaeon]|nr:Fe-S cluster assembly scaffold IscU [Euryarchaeota archaeon]|tara:strand:+ start:3168 stop:3593 length:426 start_codon:yes stop_codon:yes gene_type:complete